MKGGDWVRITGLQSAVGQKLNGKVGQLLVKKLNDEGRYAIQIDCEKEGKVIKESNIQAVTPKEMVKTYRLACNREGLRSRKIILFPKSHSMFQCDRRGNALVLALCGLPIMVKKVKPYVRLREREDYDNQWATWMMIDPRSGFAPPEWQSYVGPVLVYRPGGFEYSYDDVNVTNDFVSALFDQYPDGPDFDPSTWLNEEFFQKVIRCQKDNAEANNRRWHLNILN